MTIIDGFNLRLSKTERLACFDSYFQIFLDNFYPTENYDFRFNLERLLRANNEYIEQRFLVQYGVLSTDYEVEDIEELIKRYNLVRGLNYAIQDRSYKYTFHMSTFKLFLINLAHDCKYAKYFTLKDYCMIYYAKYVSLFEVQLKD